MGGSGFLIVLLGMFAVMYFLLIRPQKAKQRAAQDMLSRLAPGDEVITIGGIYGDVVEVHDDKVVVEIAEDVHIEVARRAISSIVPPETPETGPGKGSRASTSRSWSASPRPTARRTRCARTSAGGLRPPFLTYSRPDRRQASSPCAATTSSSSSSWPCWAGRGARDHPLAGARARPAGRPRGGSRGTGPSRRGGDRGGSRPLGRDHPQPDRQDRRARARAAHAAAEPDHRPAPRARRSRQGGGADRPDGAAPVLRPREGPRAAVDNPGRVPVPSATLYPILKGIQDWSRGEDPPPGTPTTTR